MSGSITILRRRAVLCEASDEYADMAEGRADGTWKPPAKAVERDERQIDLFARAQVR